MKISIIRKMPVFKAFIFLVVCLFSINSLSIASESIKPYNFQGSKLAVKPLSSDDVDKTPAEFTLIQKALEKIASGEEADSAGGRISYLVDWLRRERFNFTQKEPFSFIQYGNEVLIYAKDGYLIRFYDTQKTTLERLFEGARAESLVYSFTSESSTDRIETYKTSSEFPINYNPALIFDHIIEKAGLENDVELKVGEFPLNSPDEHAICALQPDGKLVVHTLFLKDHKKIRESGLGFPYTFSDDGATRWIDVANSIVYRVAMHEFKLDGRDGHGHGYLDDDGNFQISEDEEKANTVGRRYSTVDDAAYLWYLHSFKETDEIRYDNKKFKERINWIFYDTSQAAQKAREYFPALVKDEAKREEAIRIALLINEAFFVKRKEAGIDVLAGDSERDFDSDHWYYLPKGTVFAEGNNRDDETESKSPEDSLGRNRYKPHIKYKNQPERELTEREAEENASRDFQKDLASVLGELDFILARHRRAESEDEKNSLQDMTSGLLIALRTLYTNMPIEIDVSRPYNFYSKTLQKLRRKRNTIYRKIDKADRENEYAGLRTLNLEAIRINRLILKIQILMAGRNIAGRTRQKKIGLRIGTSKHLLKGAYNSAKMLEEELHYRAERLASARKRREIRTIDREGNIANTFKLGAFDIEVERSQDKTRVNRVIMKRGQWINVHIHLDKIRKDVEKGYREKALKKIDSLIRLYGLRYIVVKETYRNIANDLREMKKIVQGIPNDHAPPKETGEDIKGKVEYLVARIKHPKQKIWTDVTYEDLADSFSGKLHTILESYPLESSKILRNRADLEYFIGKIKTAIKSGRISKRNLSIILSGLTKIEEWTKRGFVYKKQFAKISLTPAIEILEVMQEAGNFNEIDASKVIAYMQEAIKRLDERIVDIDGIVENEKKRATALFALLRDEDISRRTDIISAYLEEGNYRASLEEVREIKELYFSTKHIEPGYIRADYHLETVENFADRARRYEPDEEDIERIKNVLQTVKKDIEHKSSLQVKINTEANEDVVYYVNPGTTLLGLMKMLKKDPKNYKASLGGAWVLAPRLSKIKLHDRIHVKIENGPSPAPGKRNKDVRASGGEGIKGKGPGTLFYQETGSVVATGLEEYVDSNLEFLKTFFNESQEPILLRVPVEVLDFLKEKAEYKSEALNMYMSFLQTFQDLDKGVVELFSVQKPSAKDFDYESYGLNKLNFKYDRTKSNTITFMVAFPDEDNMGYADIIERIGFEYEGLETIIMPVGIYTDGRDLSGLVRSSFLGLRILEIARKNMDSGDAFVKETLKQLRILCWKTTSADFDLSEEDLVNLATGKIGDVIRTLKKMVKLLPILPIDTEELYKIYENARKVLLAA